MKEMKKKAKKTTETQATSQKNTINIPLSESMEHIPMTASTHNNAATNAKKSKGMKG